MKASNQITMKDIDFPFNLISTRLKSQSQSLYALAFVATSLQVEASPFDFKKNVTINSRIQGPASNLAISATALPVNSFSLFTETNTTIDRRTTAVDHETIILSPKYKKSFKLKLKTIKIDRSLPKIVND